jgi:cytochrome c-type biogenesis protein
VFACFVCVLLRSVVVMSLLLIALVAGALTVLSPCTLPLLPILLGITALPGKKVRLHIVLLSFALSVLALTLLLKVFFTQLPLTTDHLRLISAGFFIFFGFNILVPQLWERISMRLHIQQRVSQLLDSWYHSPWYEVFLGMLLGPLFNSCSPTYLLLIATILPTDMTYGMLATGAYLLGVAIMLRALFACGQMVFHRIHLFPSILYHAKKIFGICMLLLGIALWFSADKWFATQIIEAWIAIDVTVWESRVQ